MAKPNITGVSAVEISDNSKTGKVSATYAAQQSCWEGCPLMGNGCYAEHDFTGFTTRRLNNAGIVDADIIAENEAAAIDTLTGQRALRLHVVGDCKTNKSAQTVAAAAQRHTSKHDQPVWSYTHAWRQVARESWHGVSILASCETTADVKRAHSEGYAAAVVVAEHKQASLYMEDGLRILPCPQQTGKSLNCASCKLCWKSDHLFATKTVIAFETHGGGEKKATAALVQIGGTK
jgi:hypothetical protein